MTRMHARCEVCRLLRGRVFDDESYERTATHEQFFRGRRAGWYVLVRSTGRDDPLLMGPYGNAARAHVVARDIERKHSATTA